MTNHPNRSKTCRPRNHLAAAGKLYPDAWKIIDGFRSNKGQRGLPDWPDLCFCPLAGAYAVVSEGGFLSPELAGDVGRLGALAAWRVTQGIYRFDETLYQSLIETPVTGDIPVEVLHRLPEWCVYIETPGMAFFDSNLYGFFAHLEYDVNTGRRELRLLIDSEEALAPIPLHLIGDLDTALDEMARESRRQSVRFGLPAVGNVTPDLRPVVEPLLSLLLYLSSQNAEIGDGARQPAYPRPKRTKQGWRLFPPDKPTTWGVGVRMGAALRRAYQSVRTEEDHPHAGPRPHIRRAHWHSFWTGPRAEPEARELKLKWLPPIPVNLENLDELPTTVRPVK